MATEPAAFGHVFSMDLEMNRFVLITLNVLNKAIFWFAKSVMALNLI